jgi:hypothetical protein
LKAISDVWHTDSPPGAATIHSANQGDDFMLNVVLAIGVVVLLVGLLVGSLPN